MDNALRNGLIQRGKGARQLFRIDISFVLLNGGLDAGFDHTVAQILLLGNLHALDGGFDVRHVFHLPDRIQCIPARDTAAQVNI